MKLRDTRETNAYLIGSEAAAFSISGLQFRLCPILATMLHGKVHHFVCGERSPRRLLRRTIGGMPYPAEKDSRTVEHRDTCEVLCILVASQPVIVKEGGRSTYPHVLGDRISNRQETF